MKPGFVKTQILLFKTANPTFVVAFVVYFCAFEKLLLCFHKTGFHKT